MATYKEVKGLTIQTLDSDPVVNAGSWSSGANLNSNRYGLGGAAASNTAAIVFGGYPNGPTGATEQWNGSSWTEVNDLNHGRGYIGSSGTSYTAALAFGGNSTTIATANLTETWDGTNWK